MNDGAFLIPGSGLALDAAYDAQGAVLQLAVGEREHVRRGPDGAWVLGDGLAHVHELATPRGLLRRVSAAGTTWTERYAWDEAGRPVEVDGVTIERDGEGRVTACRGPAGDWTYAYGRGGLERVSSPRAERTIVRGLSGRPVRLREAGAAAAVAFAYDADGVRLDAGEDPPGWHRDVLGRLWTVHDAAGRIVTTYLWSGLSCLGRIDGPPDAPLAAAYLLDPTGTPVRVVERDRVLRIPRDAFGEALLDHAGVPGLFGGPVHEGLVRLPLRGIDPRAGAFERPDPLDGRERDPRRAGGFEGLLAVDHAVGAAGRAYAVCNDDPIARSDPSGGISAAVIPMILSSLTWSSQYHVVNIPFLQLFANLLPSLFSTDSEGRWAMRRFFSWDAIASQAGGGFGLRFDPVGIEAWVKLFAGAARRFTLSQVLWFPADEESWDGLRVIRMFAPAGELRPTGYGTILRAEADGSPRWLLQGTTFRVSAAAASAPPGEPWVRHGGTAAAVFPGSRVPGFPDGGLHFARRGQSTGISPDMSTVHEFLGPKDGRVAELAPSGTLAQGTAADSARLRIPATGLGLIAGRHLLLTRDPNRELHDVVHATERDGRTSVRLARAVAMALAPGDTVDVRGATVDAATDNLIARAQPERLDARAATSTIRHARGEFLQLTAAGGTPIVAEIARLEVGLTLDADGPTAADQRLPWDIVALSPSGAAQPVTRVAADTLEFPAGQTPPDEGAAVLVSGGGASAAFVVKHADNRQRRLDRALPAAVTDPLTWRPLAVGARLGLADAAGAGTALTYEPGSSGLAPAAGTALLLRSDVGAVARSVAAVTADDLVLTGALAGVAAGTALTAAKLTLSDPDVRGATVDPVQTVTLAPAADRAGRTLRLHQLTTVAPAAGSPLVQAGARSGDTVAFALPAPATLPGLRVGPTPGQLVMLTPDTGPGPQPAVVHHVRLTVTLDRRLPFPPAVAAAGAVPPPAVLLGGLDVVPLAAAGPAHNAERVDEHTVVLKPEMTIAPDTVPLQFARPAVGDIVEVAWTGGAAQLHQVTAVEGETATLDGDGGTLPAATPGLTVQRLDADDPGNGTTRIGRAGDLLTLGAATSDLRVDVWAPNALAANARVVVTDGTLAFPAHVTAPTRLEIGWLAGPPLDAAATTVTIGAPALQGTPVTLPSAAEEDGDLVLDASTGLLTSGPNLVVVVEYGEERGVATGTFDAGSVVIPDEPTTELTRHQALIDHELTHSTQFALWGPIMLSPAPFRGLEEIIEAAGHPYPSALHHIGKLYSVGGLMNFLSSTIISGIAWVIYKLVFFFVRLFRGQPLSFGWLGHADWLTFKPATIPDASAPRRIQLAAAGEPALAQGDLVEITAGTSYHRASVVSVAGAAVELDQPAPTGADLQIAKVADHDETSLVEHAVMRHTGFGAAEKGFDIVFDPWSQLANRGHLRPGSWEDILFRVARDLFGSSSWTLFPFGYFFWDNAIKNKGGSGYLSKMEQSASAASGENYSPIGRLDGTLEVVGDVARYWHFVERRHDTALNAGAGGGDAPVSHTLDLLRMMPSARDNALLASSDPNGIRDAAPDAENPGAQVPNVFAAKSVIDPRMATAAMPPRGFPPTLRGAVPVGAHVERSIGAYVAFTRPPVGGPSHRITSTNGFFGADKARDAQEQGKQTIFFDQRVSDVEVQLVGAAVAEGGRVQLLRGQRATLAVTPNGDRRYGAAVQRPRAGTVLRTDGDLVVVAQGVNGVEPVEIARRYRFDAATGHFDHSALDTHGMHLPGDVHIPVRRLDIEVVDTIAPRAAADPRAAALVAPSHAGEVVFVVIPATVTQPLRRRSVTYSGVPPVPVTDPSPDVGVETPSAEVLTLIGGGAIQRVTFGAQDPPEAACVIVFAARVAIDGGDTEVTCTVALEPHFTLDAGSFTVARGASLALTCSGTVRPGAVTVAPPDGITVTTNEQIVTLAIAAGAATVNRTVLVADSAAPGHFARRTFTVTP